MEVRFFKKSERQLLLDSIDRLWRHDHIYVRKPEVLDHLVLHTPYRAAFAGEENYSFLGMWDDDGEVVGLYGAIPQEMNCFGETYPSETGTIWIVDKTKHHHIDGLDFYDVVNDRPMGMHIGMGLSKFSVAVDRMMGYEYIRDLPRWIAVQKMDEALAVLLPDASVRPYMPVMHPVSLDATTYHVTIDAFDATHWDAFYTGHFAPRYIGTKRDARFLQWRYGESPVLKYHFLTVEDAAGEVHGLAVVRIEPICEGKYKIGRILEFIAIEAEPSVVLANAVATFDPEVLMWDFYCMSDITSFGLEAVGFRRLPEWMDKTMMPTRFQPVDYEHMKLNADVWVNKKLRKHLNSINSQQWYVTKGDADQDRAN